jgi:ribosomal protein L3 glutamine methyltransferase
VRPDDRKQATFTLDGQEVTPRWTCMPLELLALVADQQRAARLETARASSFGHGTTNAFDEAAWLVLWRWACRWTRWTMWRTRRWRSRDAARSRPDRRAHRTRKPAAYLTGEAWLQGVPFFVDERVIVPRSLIAEVLADGTLDVWLGEHTQRVLDLCTGNGSLAVLAALAWPEVTVDGRRPVGRRAGRGAPATSSARPADRITLLPGRRPGGRPGRAYDLILCNPPYVNRSRWQACPPSTAPSPRWPWPVATTAWTSSARCCARRPAT